MAWQMEALEKLEQMDRRELEKLTTEELRTALDTLRWWKALKRTNNDHFLPLFFDQHRFLVLKGGGGSGKSIFAGRKVLERVTGEENHRWLVCRKVGRTLRESCFAQLRRQIAEYYPDSGAKIYTGDMRVQFPNGSEILFSGLDDVEKLKSIFSVTGIWIEEASELLEEDFGQLDIRLRTEFPFYLQMILTFNPISINHWLKKRFFDFDIKDPKAREKAIARTRVHESTYKDNRFLIKEAIETLEAFKHTDQYYYTVYCLGQWGVTGKTVFDAKAVSRRLEEIKGRAKTSRGAFHYDYDGLRITSIRWIEDEDGTDGITRPVIISGLIEVLRGHYDLIEDEETLLELLTFVKEPKTLRPQAEPGAHDDCVMALAISFYIRTQQSMSTAAKEPEGVEWTHDMWEDYYSADDAGRQYLIAKWGQPRRQG